MCRHSRHTESSPTHFSKQQWGGNSSCHLKERALKLDLTSFRSSYLFRRFSCSQRLLKKSADIDCLMTKSVSPSRVGCKHVLCLLLAYFALTAGAEVAETARHQHLTEESTTHAASAVKEDSYYIPSSEHSKFSPYTLKNGFTTVQQGPKEDKPTTYKHKRGSFSPTRRQAVRSLSAFTPSEDHNSIEVKERNVSHHFIAHLFSRYNDGEYLMVESLEKMMEHIGLVKSVDGSDHPNYDAHADHHHPEDDHVHVHEESGEHHSHGLSDGHNHQETNPHNHEDSHEHDNNDYHENDHQEFYEHDHQDSHAHNHQDSDEHGHQHFHNNGESRTHDYHAAASSSNPLTSKASRSGRRRLKRDNLHQHDNHSHFRCMSLQEVLESYGFQQLNKLTATNFLHLCPALIDQLDAGYCKVTSTTDHSHDEHDHGESHAGHDHSDSTDGQEQDESHTFDKASTKVWLFALLSVAVISLCSLAGIVVIPNMKRTFYNHTLQFLVALAVGAMSGDAMLHLLPHALLSESHHDDHHHHHDRGSDESRNDTESQKKGEPSPHLAAMYKGLVALLGIYCFFFLERLFTLFTKNRSGKRRRKHKKRRHCPEADNQRSQTFNMVNDNLDNETCNTPSCDDMVMVVHPNKALKAYADVSHEAFLHSCDESLVLSPSGHEITGMMSNGNQLQAREETIVCRIDDPMEGAIVEGPSKTLESETAIVSDAEILGVVKESEPPVLIHTHSHSHSHVGQDFRGSLSSVAMMVVVGDMVHNFCDGLAIGAAFAGSIAGGLSTSVAVFCHELPHEIGDFAVLVRSGLTLKKAVYFNLFSSLPCFIGAIIGLAVGNLASTSLWIFAAVGGMFLYITLVDLIPEMSSVYTKCGEPWFLHLLLQASGIALGTTIMLVISVAEESLMTIF